MPQAELRQQPVLRYQLLLDAVCYSLQLACFVVLLLQQLDAVPAQDVTKIHRHKQDVTKIRSGDSRMHRVIVLVVMVLCEAVDADAEGLEAVRLDDHHQHSRVSFVEQALLQLLQLLQHVQLHAVVAAVVNKQQAEFDRFLTHAPELQC